MTDAAHWEAFFTTFHERFPSHVGKRRRQEMFSLAKRILSDEISTKQAEVVIDRSVHEGHVQASDKALVMFLVFIAMWAWTMLIEPRLDTTSIENPETKQRFFEALFEKFDQTLKLEPVEEQWPFPGSLFERAEPAVPLRKTPPRSPARSQNETSASPKAKRRTLANRSKKKS